MLQIRLSKPANEGGGAKPSSADSVTVACPDHLVLADLPVAKSLGSLAASAKVKIVGRRSRRQLGERVHFCAHCDLPIAIYGRLSPCEHVFCLDCARSDSLCFICDERIQKIQTIKMMEGIFICAAPHCLKSFLKRSDFESHIHVNHADLLHPTAEKDGYDSEAASSRKPTASDSTVHAPPRPVFSLGSNSLAARDQPAPKPFIQPKAMPTFSGQIQDYASDQQLDSNPPPGFDRIAPQNRFVQLTFDSQGGMRQEQGQIPDKQQGVIVDSPFPEYPTQPLQPPSFAVPFNPNPVLAPPQFGYPPFVSDGAPPFYGAAPYEMARQELTPEVRSEQGSLLGFPPGPPGGVNFAESYPQPWNTGPAVQVTTDSLINASDHQGRPAIFQGDYSRNPGISPSNLPLPPPVTKGMESGQDGSNMDPRDGKGILAPQPLPLPPPPPFPPHLSRHKRGQFYSNEMNVDGKNFGWQSEKHEGFGISKD